MMFDTVAQTKEKTDKKTGRQVDGLISDLCGALADPILSWPAYADMKPPEDFMATITMQRLIENMAAIHEGREPLASDAETAWYISTRSFESPMGSEWNNCYMYCFTKTRDFMRKDVPTDLRLDELTSYEMNEYLLPLKRWIYRKRAEHRKEGDKADRKEKREHAKQEKELEVVGAKPENLMRSMF